MIPSRRMLKQLQSRAKQGFYGRYATIHYKTLDSLDAYGQPTYTIDDVDVVCSFADTVSRESWAEYADIESVEAEIRFEGDKPNKGDTVTLKNTFNSDSLEYEIVGVKDRDAFGYVCALKVVRI